jgi:hypothetical protein
MENDSVLFEWSPLDFGFNVIRQSNIMEEVIWAKKQFRLRYLGNNYWLCTKKIKKTNKTEIVTNFCKEVRPEDKEFASWLLEKRL